MASAVAIQSLNIHEILSLTAIVGLLWLEFRGG